MKIKLVTSLALSALIGVTSVSAINVALELALLIDVSDSINPSEYALQKDGYEAAFRDPDIISAIESQPGGIAVTFVEWAGRKAVAADAPEYSPGEDIKPMISIGWMHLFDAASSNAFADALAGLGGKPTGLGPFTNIVGAINFGAGLFAGNGFEGDRQVIDISGDGPDNYNGIPAGQIPIDKADAVSFNTISGPAVAAASAAALGLGVDAINGLPVVLPTADFADLKNWYETFVIAGSGAFVEASTSYEDIGSTIKRKIEREIITEVPDTGATVALLGLGLLALGSVRRWKRV